MRTKLRAWQRCAPVVATLLGFGSASAQGLLEGGGFPVNYEAVEFGMTHVAGRVHMLSGAGGNIGVFTGDDGVFLVDGQFAPLTERIVAEVAQLSDDPIRFLINTHFHGDHTGSNANFARAGARIIAHDNTRRILSGPHYIEMIQTRFQAFGPNALPSITFESSMSFNLSGERIDVIHAPPSHTNGDSVIFFRESNVLHMGDIYRSRGQPIFDRNNGGSYEGLIRASDFVLNLINEDTLIVPGHGQISTRADLQEVRNIMATVRDRIQAGIEAGQSEAEIVASDPSRGFPWRDGRLTIDETVRWIHTELAAKSR
ncbi:MAG: MBL fold metallo-hydrolase [Gammaproteobacteria bacterium]|nr:MBL fold metallo-hydrolase [Gammaproteobacteria bacterium]